MAYGKYMKNMALYSRRHIKSYIHYWSFSCSMYTIYTREEKSHLIFFKLKKQLNSIIKKNISFFGHIFEIMIASKMREAISILHILFANQSSRNSYIKITE